MVVRAESTIKVNVKTVVIVSQYSAALAWESALDFVVVTYDNQFSAMPIIVGTK